MFNVTNLIAALLPAMQARYVQLKRAERILEEARDKVRDEVYPISNAIDQLQRLEKMAKNLSRDDVEHLNELAAQAVELAKFPPEPQPNEERNGPPDDLVEILPEDD